MNPAANPDLEASRRPNGQFGTKLHLAPECAPLAAAGGPFDLTTLEEGEARTIAPETHGIDGLGAVEVAVKDDYMILTMRHPEGTDLRDLYNWDDGSRDVTAYSEALEVAGERLGLTGNETDQIALKDGAFTFVSHVPVNADLTLDPEDLSSWASEFIALADPAGRHDFTCEVVERYEAA